MAKEKELSFEENLNNLETIVKDLESGNVPLDDAINKFTEAMKIAKTCDEKLKNAEENVNKILNKDGSLSEFKIEEE
ncbi:MAG: exodeoxyribonuclease VII small subunit [Firmicutes bacterium]|nr:exodeoxyribonuclease VII small subunit [Bacillota bacterium]